MSTDVAMDVAALPARPSTTTRIALLGCGTVGSAVAQLLESEGRLAARITSALVRKARARRQLGPDVEISTDPAAALRTAPDLVIEVLGGREPARALVREALQRGIPVVTANKTLLAHHGAELREIASRTGTPLLYEAAVIAGVPFLGAFARRPFTAQAHALVGILNGTTNYVLTRATRDAIPVGAALADAQQRGYAEPDPSRDVNGTDAAEKLAVLLQHFGRLDVDPHEVETRGLEDITASTIEHARALGGAIRQVAWSDWSRGPEGFVGPVFVPFSHPLVRVDGVENALLLACPRGRLLFQGPGAGAAVTAATILDDVAEIVRGVAAPLPGSADLASAPIGTPETGWLLSLAGERLPRGADVADYLGSFGIFVRSTTPLVVREGEEHRAYLTWPATAAQSRAAAGRLSAAAGCRVYAIRSLGELE